MKGLECLVALLAVLSFASGKRWGSSLQGFSDQVVLANRCLPVVGAEVPIDGDCDAANACVGQGTCSSCDQNGKCVCRANFVEHDLTGPNPLKICIGATRIGSGCTVSEQCVSFHPDEVSSCEGTSHQCQCIADYIYSGDFERCLPVRNELGDPCEDDTQCQGSNPTGPGVHSRCFGSRCECKPGAVNVIGQHKCYLVATQLGDQCEVQAQCDRLRAVCSPNNVCQCNADNVAHPDGSICLPRREMIGEECEDDVQCIRNSKCVKAGSSPSGVCVCDVGFVGSTSGRTCFILAEQVGDSCIPNDDTGNIQCGTNIRGQVACYPATPTNTTHGNCACSPGFVGSGDGKACLLRNAELEEPCEDDNQCAVPNSRCKIGNPETGAGFCECQGEYRNIPGERTKCWKIIRDINLECEIDFQCKAGMGKLSYCMEHTCQCRYLYGYYPDQGRCLVPARMRWPCSETEQCYVGVWPKPISRWFLCTNRTEDNRDGIKRCVCHPDAREFEESCYDRSIKLGSDCQFDLECSVNIRGPSRCDPSTKKCVCKEGFVEDAGKVRCYTPTGTGIFSGTWNISTLFAHYGAESL